MENATKHKGRRYLYILLVLLILMNVLPIERDNQKYSTADGSYTAGEYLQKGDDFNYIQRTFASFKRHVAEQESSYVGNDTTLYRISRRNWAKVWLLKDYLMKEKYRVPYKAWTDIEATRTGPLEFKSNYQQF